MDKLIDYNGLSTFKTNLLNDNATSELATWSSEKINTSKQNKLTAGNNIRIYGDTISAGGYVFNSSLGSFAEGTDAEATGSFAHAEGCITTASGNDGSHVEGRETRAEGSSSHAEGNGTKASGSCSHAEGSGTKATGGYSHAEGLNTETQNTCEHAEGKINKSHQANDTWGNAGNTLHSIGIGYYDSSYHTIKRNAVEVMQNADVYVKGVGNYDGIHIKGEQGAPANLQTLQEVISSLTSTIASLEARIAALENPNA